MGTYNYLLENNSYFANFVSNSFAIQQNEPDDDENSDKNKPLLKSLLTFFNKFKK